MARGEDAIGYRDLAGDDTLTGQWSLLSGKRCPYGRLFYRWLSALSADLRECRFTASGSTGSQAVDRVA
jgi:hypothetical protein